MHAREEAAVLRVKLEQAQGESRRGKGSGCLDAFPMLQSLQLSVTSRDLGIRVRHPASSSSGLMKYEFLAMPD